MTSGISISNLTITYKTNYLLYLGILVFQSNIYCFIKEWIRRIIFPNSYNFVVRVGTVFLISYLGKEGLINLYSFVRSLKQHLLATSPTVAHRRVRIGHASEKHCSLIVKLFFSFTYALMNSYYWIIQV